MRSRLTILMGAALLFLFVSCCFVGYVSQVEPRLNADAHTSEMCSALQRVYDVALEIRDTGDVGRLPEIYTAAGIAEETQAIEDAATEEIVTRNIERITTCKAVSFSPIRAEVDATTLRWTKTYHRRSGIPIMPADPNILNRARESRLRAILVNEQGLWKYLGGEEYGWRFVSAEPPAQ